MTECKYVKLLNLQYYIDKYIPLIKEFNYDKIRMLSREFEVHLQDCSVSLDKYCLSTLIELAHQLSYEDDIHMSYGFYKLVLFIKNPKLFIYANKQEVLRRENIIECIKRIITVLNINLDSDLKYLSENIQHLYVIDNQMYRANDIIKLCDFTSIMNTPSIKYYLTDNFNVMGYKNIFHDREAEIRRILEKIIDLYTTHKEIETKKKIVDWIKLSGFDIDINDITDIIYGYYDCLSMYD